MLVGKSIVTLHHKCVRKTSSTFRGKRETSRGYFTTRRLFLQFSRKRAHDCIMLKMRSYSAFRIKRPTKYREIAIDFTLFGSCLIKKNWAIFIHFSTLRSVIFRWFFFVLDGNIASVLLFQNLGNLKTNTTKIPVLVLQKLSLLDLVLSWLHYSKNSNNLFNPMTFNVLYLGSSTRWRILLFIIFYLALNYTKM